MAKRVINGEVVMVPILIGFQNVGLPSPFELNLPFGIIKDLRTHVYPLLPYDARPHSTKQQLLGFVLQAEYPYSINICDRESLYSFTNTKKFEYSAAQLALERVIDKVKLTLALGIKRDKPVGATNSWSMILSPLSSSANIVRKSFSFSVPSYIVTEEDRETLRGWADLVDKADTTNIEIAIRRILGALTNRTDPVDGFIDSVIAWENVFGGRGELAFRVSMAMAFLLESKIEERLKLQKELYNLYNKRSEIVHGSSHLDAAEAIEKRNRALNLILDCLRRLIKEQPDLLADKDRSKKILLAGNIQ
jgi:hypothetical protein